MDTLDCIRTRPAIRGFLSRPIPHRVIQKILEAGRQAHSQRNRQPWRFIVVQNRATLAQLGALASSGPFIGHAPLAIVVTVEGAKNPPVDGTRAVECLMLAAWNEGLGSCWVGGIDRPQVKALLDIPDAAELITIVPFGYPTAEEKTHKKVRKRLSRLVYGERYGRAYEE